MLVEEKAAFEKLDAEFAKKGNGMDVQNGDIVVISGDVVERDNRFNPEEKQKNIKLRTRNGDRYMNLNQTSINILIKEYNSKETADWVGRKVKVILKPDIVAGKRVLIGYLVGLTWELDEYGALVDTMTAGEATQTAPDEEIPTINLDEDKKDEIKIEDVPF